MVKIVFLCAKELVTCHGYKGNQLNAGLDVLFPVF